MKITLLFTLIFSSFNLFGSITLVDKRPLPDVRATTYYIADEEKTSCRGVMLVGITMVVKEQRF